MKARNTQKRWVAKPDLQARGGTEHRRPGSGARAWILSLGFFCGLACGLMFLQAGFLPRAGARGESPTVWAGGAFVPLVAYDGRGAGTAEPSPTATNTVVPPAADPLVAPYLGQTTQTSVVVAWASEEGGQGEVRYSLDGSYGQVAPASSEVYDGAHWYAATITGLSPGTTYHYRVYTGGVDLTPWSDVTLTTAPGPAASSFTFAALGDGRPSRASNPPSQGARDVAARMAARTYSLALHAGDIVYAGGQCSGADSAWQQYKRAYFDLYQASLGHTPFYPSVGNHELNGGSCGYQSYRDVYHLPANAPAGDEETYYSFDYANAHFVALDTSQDYSPGSRQHTWLQQDLGAATQPWTFVLFHDPAYSSGIHGSTPGVLAHLVPLFEAHGVDVVFAGHDHHYERTCPIRDGACTSVADDTSVAGGGVVYYVTGGAGASLYPAWGDWFTADVQSVYHYLQVEVAECWLRVDAVDTAGQTFDSYLLDRCEAGGR